MEVHVGWGVGGVRVAVVAVALIQSQHPDMELERCAMHDRVSFSSAKTIKAHSDSCIPCGAFTSTVFVCISEN